MGIVLPHTKKMDTVVIPYGKHRGKPNLFGFHTGTEQMVYHVMFEENCLYPIEDKDDLDINKLFGVSFLRMRKFDVPHHTDSIRFGWRCSEENWGKIRIYPYWYNKGTRHWYDKKNTAAGYVNILPKKWYIFVLNLNYDSDTFEMMIYPSDSPVAVWKHIQHFEYPKWKWGYFLSPYHGGDKTAPQNEVIHFGLVER